MTWMVPTLLCLLSLGTWLIRERSWRKKEREAIEKNKEDVATFLSQETKRAQQREEAHRQHYLAFKMGEATLSERMKHKEARITELEGQLQAEKQRIQVMQTDLRAQTQQLATARERLAGWESTREQKEEFLGQSIAQLGNARETFIDEKKRLEQEQIEQREAEEEERNRLWKRHEEGALAHMKAICQKKDILLPTFDNQNLPEGFDLDLKPDFLVQVLDQYVIFDAKMSSPKNLAPYLKEQAKKTASRIKASESTEGIFRLVYFVVPAVALVELKQLAYHEQGYTFYIISLASFESLITLLKRLDEYQILKDYNPQEREEIIAIVAAFENQIRYQNAANILGAMKGLKTLEEKGTLPDNLAEAIESHRDRMRLEHFKPSELKKLVRDPLKQGEEISRLVGSREALIEEKEIFRVAGYDEKDQKRQSSKEPT